MADLKFEFISDYHKDCYEKVARFLVDMFGEMALPHDEYPDFSIRFGSAIVVVSVRDWGDDDAIITVYSWVIRGAEMTPELMEFLLNKNYNIRFGAFSVDEDNDIHFGHTIVGSTIEKNELRASIMGVANIADEYDDEIQQRWGGNKALR